jgi:hypothetical protein
MNIDENTDFTTLKRKLFFSTLMSKFIVGLFWIFYALWNVIKFIFAPIALLIELFIIVPIIYFTNKQDRDINLTEIDMDILHDKVFEAIQEDIAIFENHGFAQIKLVQGHLVDDKGTILTQLMLNESNGIALALMYGVFKDSEGEYSNIQISYQEFDFETNSGEEFEFHNAEKESIPMTNRVKRLYIEEYNSETLYKKVLDIAQKLDIVINKNTMQEIKNNPIALMKKSYQTDMEYLIETGFFKLKDNYFRPSIKASIISIFKEMWPVSGYLTKKSWERTLKFFRDINFNIEEKDYYPASTIDISLQQKVTTLSDINTFLSTIDSHKFKVSILEFHLDSDNNIEETSIYLGYQKPIGRGKCVAIEKQLVLNNSELKCFIYDNPNIEIEHCSSKLYIKEFQEVLTPRVIVDLITKKYPNAYIGTIYLTPTDYEVSIEIEDDIKSPYRTLHIDCKSGEWITSVETFENNPTE